MTNEHRDLILQSVGSKKGWPALQQKRIPFVRISSRETTVLLVSFCCDFFTSYDECRCETAACSRNDMYVCEFELVRRAYDYATSRYVPVYPSRVLLSVESTIKKKVGTYEEEKWEHLICFLLPFVRSSSGISVRSVCSRRRLVGASTCGRNENGAFAVICVLCVVCPYHKAGDANRSAVRVVSACRRGRDTRTDYYYNNIRRTRSWLQLRWHQVLLHCSSGDSHWRGQTTPRLRRVLIS